MEYTGEDAQVAGEDLVVKLVGEFRARALGLGLNPEELVTSFRENV